MRLIFINRFFYPDESATSLMLTDLVEGLAPLGLEMRVITATASYTGSDDCASVALPANLAVTRLPNLSVSHQSLLGRVLNFVAFYYGLILAGLRHLRRDDVIICLTDPPFVGIVATLLAQLKGASVVHWVQDIYPETATSLGFGSPSNPLIRLVAALRDWAWSKAAINVVIGEQMLAKLQMHGVGARQVKLIQNWADDAQLVPLDPQANPLREEWGFDDRNLVIGYSGNLGRAHDVQTILEAARLLVKDADGMLQFLFIGGGAKHALLQSAMAEDPLAGIIERRAYRPRAELLQSLNVPDVHWLSLEPELEGLIVPSKFYGAAAVGRPIIFIGDTGGEVARLIRKAECGASFAKGDAKGVADFISALGKDPALRRKLGDNARAYCIAELSKGQRMAEWRELIKYLECLRKLESR